MQKLLLFGLVGGAVYWFFLRQPVAQAVAAPAVTTGPPQLQAFPLANRSLSGPNLYNVEAFPMGVFGR